MAMFTDHLANRTMIFLVLYTVESSNMMKLINHFFYQYITEATLSIHLKTQIGKYIQLSLFIKESHIPASTQS